MNILEVVYQICLNNIAVNFQYKKKSDYKSCYTIGDLKIWVSAKKVEGEYEFRVTTDRLTLKVHQITMVYSAVILAFNSHELNRPTAKEILNK